MLSRLHFTRERNTVIISLLSVSVLAVLIISVMAFSAPRDLPNILITEVLSSNNGIVADEDGEYPDFIELYNAGDGDVELYGWYLSDNSNIPLRWTIPSIVLKPGEYVFVFASGKDKQQEDGIWHTNFSVAADGSEPVILTMPDGELHTSIEPFMTAANISFGLIEGNADFAYMTAPTPGTANQPPYHSDLQNLMPRLDVLVITEYMTSNDSYYPDDEGLFHDWVEIYNPGDEAVSLTGWHLSDNGANIRKWKFPDNISIPAKGFLVLHCSGQDMAGHVSFRLSGNENNLILSDRNGEIIDSIPLISTPMYVSYGRSANPEHMGFFAVPTPGAENTDTPVSSIQDIAWDKPTILIMEYMSGNGVFMDEDGDTSDWVELYNYGSETVVLSDIWLSDSALNPDMWRFPADAVIAPDERIVVWLSGKYREGHASFAISETDDGLFLSDRFGRTIDSMIIYGLLSHVSAGRSEDDHDTLLFFPRPTPGMPNDTIGFSELAGLDAAGWGVMNTSDPNHSGEAVIIRAFPVQTNVDDIYLETGKLVSLWTDEREGSIYYTLDGAEPTELSARYTRPIAIAENTALRARVFAPDKEPSEVFSRTYLVGVTHSIPIVSLTTDPAGMFSHSTGIYADGPGWGGDYPHFGANFHKDWERAVHFAFYENGKLCVESNAGIKIHGAFSRAEPQKSLAIHFRGIYGRGQLAYPFIPDIGRTVYDALLLRTSGQDWGVTKLKDAFISNSVINVTNVVTMGARPVAVYINGEYWGLYNLREKINEDWFMINEGIPDGEIDIIARARNALAGTNTQFTAMEARIENMSMKTEAAYDYVDANIDLDNWIDYWVIVTYFSNTDISGNIKYYRQHGEGHKWRWILFDQDHALQPFNYSINMFRYIVSLDWFGTDYGWRYHVLPNSLLSNDIIRERFIERYAELMKTVLSTDRLLGILDDYAAQIKPEMPSHIARWGQPSSMNAWEKNLEQLRNYVIIREGYVKSHLKSTYGISDARMDELFG